MRVSFQNPSGKQILPRASRSCRTFRKHSTEPANVAIKVKVKPVCVCVCVSTKVITNFLQLKWENRYIGKSVSFYSCKEFSANKLPRTFQLSIRHDQDERAFNGKEVTSGGFNSN